MQTVPGKTGDIEPEVKIPGLFILVNFRMREDGLKFGAARIVIGDLEVDTTARCGPISLRYWDVNTGTNKEKGRIPRSYYAGPIFSAGP